jgi:cytosolic iron-sulfur protein assembly protein CIAO1
MMEQNGILKIKLLSELNPPLLTRAWSTTPHPRLPIVATCASDKTVHVYSLSSFTQLSTITGGHKRSIRSCAWKPNLEGEIALATGSFDSNVGLWRRQDEVFISRETDFTNGENDDEEDEEWRYALVLEGHDSEVKCVAWSAGGNFLATCSRDKSVWIWEEVGDDDYETIAVLQEHSGDVKSVAWHPEEVMLASGSYDDDIRLWKEDVDDWTCMGILKGHKSTVWQVEWEGLEISRSLMTAENKNDEWVEKRRQSGPRLASCSDDQTIRIWRRVPSERKEQNALSIIRSGSIEEEWIEEARLPQKHDRAIYAICWSKKTGRIVSTGGDGKVVVYEERWESESTSWTVIAELESSHDVFETNHVVWASRADRDKKFEDEEVIITTGDDGTVKVWSIES